MNHSANVDCKNGRRLALHIRSVRHGKRWMDSGRVCAQSAQVSNAITDPLPSLSNGIPLICHTPYIRNARHLESMRYEFLLHRTQLAGNNHSGWPALHYRTLLTPVDPQLSWAIAGCWKLKRHPHSAQIGYLERHGQRAVHKPPLMSQMTQHARRPRQCLPVRSSIPNLPISELLDVW